MIDQRKVPFYTFVSQFFPVQKQKSGQLREHGDGKSEGRGKGKGKGKGDKGKDNGGAQSERMEMMENTKRCSMTPMALSICIASITVRVRRKIRLICDFTKEMKILVCRAAQHRNGLTVS